MYENLQMCSNFLLPAVVIYTYAHTYISINIRIRARKATFVKASHSSRFHIYRMCGELKHEQLNKKIKNKEKTIIEQITGNVSAD